MCCFEALQVIQPKAISWMIFSIIPPAAESLIIIIIHCTVGAGLSSENEEYMPFCAFYFQYGYSASAIDHDFNVAVNPYYVHLEWLAPSYCELCAATDHDAYLIPPLFNIWFFTSDLL